ncbi:hypothetical protein [Duganella sp. CF517]|uniref:hypothetical protein n=1 Tax=Duganella sp. CF517 TaxID=1881038 RepID=UPI000B7C98E3|nr:hypothetical protein [Duganella sp. CF517]
MATRQAAEVSLRHKFKRQAFNEFILAQGAGAAGLAAHGGDGGIRPGAALRAAVGAVEIIIAKY